MKLDYNPSRDAKVAHTPLSASAQQTGLSRLFDLVVFAVPAVQFIQVEVVGTLYASDLVVMGVLPFIGFSQGHRLLGPLPRKLIGLALLWLFGQVVTDVVRGTPFQDYARGWAKILFFLISFAVIYLLLRNDRRRILLYAGGMVTGGLLSFYFTPGAYTAVDPWKFGIGAPLTLLVVLLATQRVVSRLFILQAVVLAFAVLLNLYMGFRALAGVCFLTAIYTSVQRLGRRRESTVPSMTLLVVMGLAAAFAFLAGYEYAAKEGVLGQAAREKYQWQAAGKLGVLVGARAEILISGVAIRDSPILGHGSWAKDPEYASLWLEVLRSLGYKVGPSDVTEAGLIPTHSHLFGAWVEAGALGAIFWVWVLLLATRALARLYRMRNPLTPLIAFLGFMLIWDVFFSPFGAERRFITPYYLILLMTVLEASSARETSGLATSGPLR